MNRSLFLVTVLALVLVGASAAADTYGAGVDHIEEEASTKEITCGQASQCDGPSVDARLEAGGGEANVESPDASCLADGVGGNGPACETTQPHVDPGVLRVYVGVKGLDEVSGASDEGELEAQGSQAAPSDGTTLDASMVATIAAGALGLGATGAVATFGLRRFATFLLAPLAARLQKHELLEDDTRRALYETIREDPGINLRALADRLELAWGTLLHHLGKLEKAHMITTKRYGKYRRCFLNGSTYSADEKERLAALSTPSTARVAEYILENPGATQSEIGEALGVTPSTVLWHARRLKDVELLETKREGRYVKYFPQLHDHEVQALAA